MQNTQVNINVVARTAVSAVVLLIVMGLPEPALAYVGPGAGLSIIGSLLAFFAAIVVGIFGFLWFPIRRMMRKRKAAAAEKAERESSDHQESDDAPTAEVVQLERGESDA